jgi:hypothetical protein
MRFPALSGRPAIVHFFFGDETIDPHFGHFAISLSSMVRQFDGVQLMMDKRLSIVFR